MRLGQGGKARDYSRRASIDANRSRLWGLARRAAPRALKHNLSCASVPRGLRTVTVPPSTRATDALSVRHVTLRSWALAHYRHFSGKIPKIVFLVDPSRAAVTMTDDVPSSPMTDTSPIAIDLRPERGGEAGSAREEDVLPSVMRVRT